jgi:hypothetical protein
VAYGDKGLWLARANRQGLRHHAAAAMVLIRLSREIHAFRDGLLKPWPVALNFVDAAETFSTSSNMNSSQRLTVERALAAASIRR